MAATSTTSSTPFPFPFSTDRNVTQSLSFSALPYPRQRSTSSSATNPRRGGGGRHNAKGQQHPLASTPVSPSSPDLPSSSSSSSSRPMSVDTATLTSSLPPRRRASLLGAASDALSGRFGLRKKQPAARPPRLDHGPPKLVLTEVIQLAPPPPGEDERERQRLREAAAQSVGIGIDLLEASDHTPRREEESIYEDDENKDENDDDDVTSQSQDVSRRPSDSRSLPAERESVAASHAESISSRPTTSGSFVPSHRRRAGSVTLSQSRISSSATPGPSVPPFPTSLSALQPFVQLANTLPKHYPAPSLLKLSISKPWKTRHVMLTSPGPPPSQHHHPPHTTRVTRSADTHAAVSYLHVFRSSSADERELERLEIHADSVVFVSDEDVGSRRHIVKVGGLDVGARRRDWNLDESGLTMVLLQIVDGAESRRWIAAIKSAILGQRSVRAGLGHTSYSLNGADGGPRGDMDVVLSMRMQGILPSPVQSSFGDTAGSSIASCGPTTSSISTREDSLSPPSTPRSGHHHHHPQRPSSPPARQGGTVLSFKGLFTGSRPRSPSSSTKSDDESEDASPQDSFGSVGSSLLGMQGPLVVKPHSIPLSLSPPTSAFPAEPPLTPAFHRRIVQHRTSVGNDPSATAVDSDLLSSSPIPPRTISPPPLHPPPHRRRAWTTNEPPAPGALVNGNGGNYGNNSSNGDSTGRIYNHGNASGAGSFGVDPQQLTPPTTASSSTSTGTGGAPKPRAASVSSVSTLGHGSENLSALLDGGNKRRWSRQSGLSASARGSPALSASGSSSTRHPYAAVDQDRRDRPRSGSSFSTSSHRTLPALAASLKRGSMSSAASASASTYSADSPLLPVPRPVSARMSMPPPQRPAPNSALPPTPEPGLGANLKPSQMQQRRPQSMSARPTSADGSGSAFKTSLRDRALRLSLLPPKTPPTDALPPRPDEMHGHRRSISFDSQAAPPPRPPPTGPLPPTPPGAAAGGGGGKGVGAGVTTLRQRLRILSSGSGSSSSSPAPTAAAVPPSARIDTESDAGASASGDTDSDVAPIGERIADPSFLVLAPTPTSTISPDLSADDADANWNGSENGFGNGSGDMERPPPMIPPRSPLRPPPPERDGGVTALAPPPTRRRVGNGGGGSGQTTVVQRTNSTIKLPEEASADMGASVA